MLFAVLSDVVRCFKPDATLTGNSYDSKFTLSLTPLSNLQGTCMDGDKQPAFVVLHYLDASSAVKNLTSETFYLDLSTQFITARFSTTIAEFAYMRGLRQFSYSFVFGNRISIPGVITLVQIVYLNATGCWDQVVIYADRARGDVSINVRPVECFISQTVEGFLEYKVDGEYHRIQIYDSAEANGFHSGNYIHENVSFFNISGTDAGADDFFEEYYTNRALEIRVVLEYQQSGQTQKVIGEVTRKVTEDTCISYLYPRIYYTINGPVVRLTTVLIAGCGVTGDVIRGTILLSDGASIKYFEREVAFSDFRYTTGFLYKEDGSEWLQTATTVSYQFYLTILDGDYVVLEETTAGYALLSCFHRVIPILQGSQVCLTMQLLELKRCEAFLNNEQDFAFSVYSDPSGDPYDMEYYFMIVSKMRMTMNLQRFCFDKASDFDISFSPNYIKGSFAARLKMLKVYAAENGQTLNFFESQGESFASETVDINDFGVYGIAFCAVVGVLAIIISSLVAFLVKKIQ